MVETTTPAYTESTFSVYEEIEKMGHEQLVICHDSATGLKAIIGIHNTVLGPALGGTRLWNYKNDQEAITDVLRLSRGMTFKNAISGLNIGGGKAVIIGDAKTVKSEALLRRFGKFVESLNGKYITAEDVNMRTEDMEFIAMETRHVTGLSEERGGGGDPSPVTAYSTYMGMKAAAQKAYGSESLTGKVVAVQGVGQVGKHLVEFLSKENAEIYVTDISEERIAHVVEEYGAKAVTMDEIYDLDVDIYAPCALGATINDDTLSRLKCDIIAGAANNQLKDEEKHGKLLLKKGVVYAPDFVINAGGVMNVCAEYMGGYNREATYRQAEKIFDTCLEILNKAEIEKIPTQEAAIKIAMKRIQDIAQLKSML
ncbi:MAG: leucine dehydrogenase [Cyclobacteriaceae bacterium]|nr:Glu/Leu/Phe/Val dehydrogenase [Cyclobacteriaceae bacterium]MCH8515506.1 leucine dehydrogenase [Cyclobacteriaceae bacterium]